MPEHGWSVLCVRQLVDETTKQVTLVDLADVLWVNALADDIQSQFEGAKAEGKKGLMLPSKLTLVTWWYRADYGQPDAGIGRIALISPAGETLARWHFPIDLGATTGFRAALSLESIPLTSLGLYFLDVERLPIDEHTDPDAKLDDTPGDRVARLPLHVKMAAKAATKPAPAAPDSTRKPRKSGTKKRARR